MTTAPRTTKAPGLPFPLQPEERVLQVVRRHWVYLWPYVAIQAVIAILPLIGTVWFLDVIGVDTGNIFWIVAIVWLLIWGVRAALAWYRYQHDIWAITNQRIVDSYRSNPLSLRISTADLVNVQDMTIQRDGLLKTALDYGDVVCKTAAETVDDFRLVGVPHPRDVQALIDRERDRERMRGRA